MNITKAVILKTSATFLFAVMAVLIRWLGDAVPLGEIVFFRSFFAHQSRWWSSMPGADELQTAVQTKRPFGHLGRGLIGVGGMFFNFAALARAAARRRHRDLVRRPARSTVALAAVVLRERVRIYRWSAVDGRLHRHHHHAGAASVDRRWGWAGFAGGSASLYALMGALCTAGAVMQTRRLTDSETTSSIVFYFSLFCAVAGLDDAGRSAGPCRPGRKSLALVASGMSGGLAHLPDRELPPRAGLVDRAVRLFRR